MTSRRSSANIPRARGPANVGGPVVLCYEVYEVAFAA